MTGRQGDRGEQDALDIESVIKMRDGVMLGSDHVTGGNTHVVEPDLPLA